MTTYPIICSHSGTWASLVKNLPAMWEPWVGKIPWRRERLPTPVFWPGESHGIYSPGGHKLSDTTERLSLFRNMVDFPLYSDLVLWPLITLYGFLHIAWTIFLFFNFFFNWRKTGLQCCVGFSVQERESAIITHVQSSS